MNGAVSGTASDLFCFCIQSDWARPKKCFSERGDARALFSDTKPTLSAFVVRRLCEIDTVSAVPKIHLRSRGKTCLLSMAEVHVPHYKIGMYMRSSAHFLEMTIQNE